MIRRSLSRRRHLALAAFAILPLFVAPAAEEAQETGFTPLFNGQNLDGWQTARVNPPESLEGKSAAFEGRFTIAEGGLLTIDPAIKGDRYIATNKEFAGDVTLRLEFNAGPKCNNDVFIRGSKFDLVPGRGDTAKLQEGVWSTLEIVITGDRIEHKIDGVTVRQSKAAPGATPFMLRAEFGTLQIRRVRYRE